MTSKTYIKMKQELKKEFLEEFIMPILKEVKDSEGEYKQEFVNEILRSAEEKPIFTYNPKTFLKEIS